MRSAIECDPGTCIAGSIGGALIVINDWKQNFQEFTGLVESWNEKTKHEEIPHPGYAVKHRFCILCGTPIPPND